MLSPSYNRWGNYVYRFCVLLGKTRVPGQCAADYFQSLKKHILTDKLAECVCSSTGRCICQSLVQNIPSSCTEALQNVHSLFSFFFLSFLSFFFNPSCEVTLSAFYVVILLIPVLNCSISLTRVHLCWPDSLIFHLSYIWNTDCRNGNKILQLWEVHACRADCWCQVQHAILFCWVWFLYFLK